MGLIEADELVMLDEVEAIEPETLERLLDLTDLRPRARF
jgi:hypothetical protein